MPYKVKSRLKSNLSLLGKSIVVPDWIVVHPHVWFGFVISGSVTLLLLHFAYIVLFVVPIHFPSFK